MAAAVFSDFAVGGMFFCVGRGQPAGAPAGCVRGMSLLQSTFRSACLLRISLEPVPAVDSSLASSKGWEANAVEPRPKCPRRRLAVERRNAIEDRSGVEANAASATPAAAGAKSPESTVMPGVTKGRFTRSVMQWLSKGVLSRTGTPPGPQTARPAQPGGRSP